MKPNHENATKTDDKAQSREYSEGQWWSPITRMLWRLVVMMKPNDENQWWSPITRMLQRLMTKPNHENTLKADDEAQSRECYEDWWRSPITRILRRPMTKPNHKNAAKTNDEAQLQECFEGRWWSPITTMLRSPMMKTNHENAAKTLKVFLSEMKVFLAGWRKYFFDRWCKLKSTGIFLYEGVREPMKLFFVWRYKKTNKGTRKLLVFSRQAYREIPQDNRFVGRVSPRSVTQRCK
jgi:hypothetical protein